MTVSRDQAMDFSDLDLASTSLSDQSRQSMNQWMSEASSQLNQLNGEISDQLVKSETASSNLDKESASIQTQADQALTDSDEFIHLPKQIEDGLNEVKAQADTDVSGVQDAADKAQFQLDQTASDAATIGQGVSESLSNSKASLTTIWADTKASATQVNESQNEMMGQLTTSNSEMNQSIAKAKAQVDAFTAQAQDQVDQANASVMGVQSAVELTRKDVITAETIVDEEVVKRGGESKMLAVNPSKDLANSVVDTSTTAAIGETKPENKGETKPENKASQLESASDSVDSNAQVDEEALASPDKSPQVETSKNIINQSPDEAASPKESQEENPIEASHTDEVHSETQESASPEASVLADAPPAAPGIDETEESTEALSDGSNKELLAADLLTKSQGTLPLAEEITAVEESEISTSDEGSVMVDAASSVTKPLTMPPTQKAVTPAEIPADAPLDEGDLKVEPINAEPINAEPINAEPINAEPLSAVEFSEQDADVSAKPLADEIIAATDNVQQYAHAQLPVSPQQPLDARASVPNLSNPFPTNRAKLTLWQRFKRFLKP